MKKMKKEVELLTDEMKNTIVKRYSASNLRKNTYHPSALIEEGVSYLQSICGSALNVLGQKHKPSDEILYKAERVLSYVNNNGFGVYGREEIRIVYIYFKIYRNYYQSLLKV